MVTLSKGGGAGYHVGFRLIRIQVGEAIRPVWSKHMQLDVQNVHDLASLVRVALRAREGCRGKRLCRKGPWSYGEKFYGAVRLPSTCGLRQ